MRPTDPGALQPEPERAVGPGDDARGQGAGDPDRELGDVALHRDAADRRGALLGEPHRAVRPGGDVQRSGCPGDRGELRDVAVGVDPSDAMDVALREPHRAVGTERDPGGAGGRRRRRELRHRCRPVARSPSRSAERSVNQSPPGPTASAVGSGAVAGHGGLRDAAFHVDPSDGAAEPLGEPHRAVGPGDDRRGEGVRRCGRSYSVSSSWAADGERRRAGDERRGDREADHRARG